MARRLARVAVSTHLLAEMLKARGVEPGETVLSSLPEDAEIVGAQFLVPGPIVELIFESSHFAELADGAEIPPYEVTFTRVSAEPKP